MTHSLTINISDEVYTYFQTIAVLTQRPVEGLVKQSIEGNLPPSIANVPPEIQPVLLKMQDYPIDALHQIATGQIAHDRQNRHAELLEKNSQEQLSATEEAELAQLRIQADQFMLQKAYAWALLRWHGQPTPTFSELSPD